jgi:hypothetical protein
VVAAAAVAALVVTRTPDAPQIANTPDNTQQQLPATGTHDDNKNDPWKDKDDSDVDDDVRALVQLANTDGARHISARWKRIEQPLAPYRALVQGVEP